jgi:hypothetical protein
LYRAAHKRLREDGAAEADMIARREYERLLDAEAVKVLSQVSIIVSGNLPPADKIGELCSLLLSYDDEEDDEESGPTQVSVSPKTKE